MDYTNLLGQIEGNSDFADLDYQQQVEVRAKVFAPQLAKDPDFVNLPADAKDKVWSTILYRQPIYKDPAYAQEMNNLTQRIKQGDKVAVNAAIAQVAEIQATDNFAITRFIEGLVTKAGQALEPIYKTIDPTHSIHVGSVSDQRKSAAYLDRMLNKERSIPEKTSLALKLFPAIKLASNVGAGFIGLAPLYMGLVGTLAEPAGLAKIGMKAVDVASQRLIKRGFGMALYKGSRVLVHAAAGGVVGILNEGLKKAMDTNWKNPDWLNFMQDAKKSFGQYFIGDLAMFTLGGLLKGMGLGAKRVFSKGFVKEASKTIDDYADGVVNALSGKIDPVMYNRLRPEQQEILKNLQRYHGVIKNVKLQTPDNILKMTATSHGFNVEIKNELYHIGKLGEKATTTVKGFGEAADSLRKLITKVPEIKLSKLDNAVLGSGAKDIKLQVAMKATIPNMSVENKTLLTKLASSNQGRYGPDQVKTFSNVILRNLGASDDVVKSLKVQVVDDTIKVYAQDKLIADVPKVVSSAKEELKTIQGLIKNLKEVVPESVKTKPVLTTGDIRKVQKTLPNYYLPFLDNLAQKKLGSKLIQQNNKFVLVNPKTSIAFDTYEEAGNYILRKAVDEKTLRLHLKYNEGLSMVRDSKTNQIKLKKSGKTIATYSDIDALMAENPNLIPKVSPDLGPKIALVDNDKLTIVYGKDSVEGNYQDILKVLDRFADYEKKASTIKLASGKRSIIEVNPISKVIELDIPEISYRKSFDSIQDAKKFISEGWTERTHLDKIAADKGYRLEVQGGKYFFYGEKNQAYIASNKEELQSILNTAPIPEWAAEYSGLEPALVETFSKPPGGMFKPTEFKIKENNILSSPSISHLYRPPDAWLVQAIEKDGDQNILKYFRQISSTFEFLTAEEGKVAKQLVGLWRGYKRKQRVKIGELLEIPEGQWMAAAKERGLTPKDVEVAGVMRKFFDTAAARFGIKYDKFISEYLPRMRKTYLKDPAKFRSDSTMVEFIQDSFGGRVPGDLDAFFKHQRVSDIVTFIREDDPLTMALKYNSIGQRETFLAPLWKEADDYLKAHGKVLDPILKARFNAYRSDVMGIPSGLGEKALIEFSKRFYAGLRGTSVTPGLASDLTKAMMSWGYLSAMGFRVWLPIRNMFQVWTTLAPRLGNSWVGEAINIVSKDKTGKIFQMLKNRGIFSENLPLYGASIIEGEQALNRLLHRGLRWYKNSDEWTRAVAYTASQLRFKDSVKRFSKGVLNEKNFMNLSGLNMLPADLKNQALGFIRGGKWANAEDVFARTITSDTMFSYRAGMAPSSFRGAVGKLFGMMGHYPVYYLENIRRAMKYSTTGQKVAFAGRFLGNSLSLYYAFKNVLGINATNFLPWTPSMFSGGPYYQLMNEALMSVGKGYEARQARAKLFGIKHVNGKLTFDPTKAEITRWGIPFGFLTHNVIKGVKHLEDGDEYLAFLAFTTAPINPDLLQKEF